MVPQFKPKWRGFVIACADRLAQLDPEGYRMRQGLPPAAHQVIDYLRPEDYINQSIDCSLYKPKCFGPDDAGTQQ